MILRMAFDGGTVAPLTKNNRTEATNPHINVLGHITRHELKSLLPATEIWNGLGNRFQWLMARRPKMVPFPKPMPDKDVEEIARELAHVITLAHQRGRDDKTGYRKRCAMTGTDLKVIAPAATEILGPDVHRLATIHTNAKTDRELLEVWLKSHADGSPHTLRVYRRVGERFLAALAIVGADLRRATVEDVQTALEAMRSKADGAPVKAASVNTYVAAVKSFLGFAHRVGFTRFNAAPLIKLKKAPRLVAQRILGELEVRMLIRAAGEGRDRLMLEVAYFGGLRVSELVSLTWSQVIRRDNGEAQLSIVGKGDKAREVLIPREIATRLFASRGDAPAAAPVFASVRRPGQPLTERAVNYIIKEAAELAGINPGASMHWLRHAHASHAIDNGAPITLVSATLGHADLKTTSVYAHARPGESSGRYLKVK
jgi:integrase/recombinase XerD